MLFEESHFSEVACASSDASRNLVMPEAKRVPIPAQEWAVAADAYCGDRLSEMDVGDVLTVKEFTHAGYIYAVFATMTGGWSGESLVYAWQLLPLQVYSGQTTGVICSSEWDRSRARGDMTGMIVKVRGRKMVCAKPVHFVRTLPTVRPLAMAEAMRFEFSLRKSGWRSSHFREAVATWACLAGHPVCSYGATGMHREMSILFWKANGTFQEHMLPRSELLSLQSGVENLGSSEVKFVSPPVSHFSQASLF